MHPKGCTSYLFIPFATGDVRVARGLNALSPVNIQ
ncbi:hypothetical protein V1280_005402 [Bradyrhizobium sp. AZCC 2230]